jgi:hypothetical protein
MNLPYLPRLFCLALASFFLVHLAAGLAVSLVGPAAIRVAERMRPRLAARLLLSLRLLPVGFGLFVVAGLCVPSYLRLEPLASAEPIGIACLAAALSGMAVWGISMARSVRAIVRSIRYDRHCEQTGRRTRPSVWVVDKPDPPVALAGIVYPRLIISRAVVRALSCDQLAAVLRHERAHRISHDNLKRLLVILAPDAFPFTKGLKAVERAWVRFAEWAADDLAVAGDSGRSLSLAAALVRVARMSHGQQPSPVASSLLGHSADLAARVDRLLRESQVEEQPCAAWVVAGGAVFAVAGFWAAVILDPAALSAVHQLLEQIIQ